MSIFGMGPGEIFLILVVALIVFGPDKLPEVARQVGKAVRDFRQLTSGLTAEFQAVTAELTDEFSELKQELREIQGEVAAVQSDVANELRQAQQAFQLDANGQPIDGQTMEGPAGSSYAVGQPGTTATYEATPVTNETSASVTSQPIVASKQDPTADVSWLDMEELVVMERTARPMNGAVAANGHAADTGRGEHELAGQQRQARDGRRAAIVYHRPRQARR